jgi:5-methylcytosine-specific restriction protein A
MKPRRGTFADEERGSRHDRGYGTHWEKLRLEVLRRDQGLCQCDDCQGGLKRVTAANEVDHRTPRAWFKNGRATGDPDALENLQAINSRCHRLKTMRENGRTPRVRRRISVDGWPIKEIE